MDGAIVAIENRKGACVSQETGMVGCMSKIAVEGVATWKRNRTSETMGAGCPLWINLHLHKILMLKS